jgi:hypothetical protein
VPRLTDRHGDRVEPDRLTGVIGDERLERRVSIVLETALDEI